MRFRIQIFISGDTDPDPGIQTNAYPDQDPGQTLKSQKLSFYMKNILEVVIGKNKTPTK